MSVGFVEIEGENVARTAYPWMLKFPHELALNSPVLARLVVLQLVFNHPNHNIIRDQSSSIHYLLRLDTKGCFLGYLFAKHVTGCQMAHTEFISYPGSLRALSCMNSAVSIDYIELKTTYQRQAVQREWCAADERVKEYR